MTDAKVGRDFSLVELGTIPCLVLWPTRLLLISREQGARGAKLCTALLRWMQVPPNKGTNHPCSSSPSRAGADVVHVG